MKHISTEAADRLIAEQLAEWPQAHDNYEALKNVRVKDLDVDGMRVRVQFNPARIVSSGAKIDPKAIRERKCFLCGENRPAVQRGIEWGPDGKYIVLINPFPIFPRHLTIPDRSHTDQLISGRVEDMMDLAEELDGYTVFYNGPKCGASAPDHMHFQAGNSDFLTIADALEDAELKVLVQEDDYAMLSLVDSLPVNVFVIDASDHRAGAELFERLYKALPVPEGEKEPMMNLLCYATPAGVRLVVIPRKRHRPACYGMPEDGPDKMLLSPASVDMGGVFITPLEKDFEALDADTVRRVLDELTLSNEEINAIAENV